MSVAYLIVTILAAAANVYAATNDFRRVEWLLAAMNRLGVSERWLTTLGVLKAAGALGLLMGTRIPVIGVAASAGLVLFFVGAMVAAARVRWYAHLPYPAVWLLMAVSALALRVATA